MVKGASKISKDIPGAVFCIEIPCKAFMPGEIFNPHFMDIFNHFFKPGYFAWEINSNGEVCRLDLEIVKGFFQASRYDGIMAVFSREATIGL